MRMIRIRSTDGTNECMSDQATDATSSERLETIRSVETLLDYAMIEGAQLKLPMLVYLLRVARLELENCLVTEAHCSSAGKGSDFAGGGVKPDALLVRP
jgi:hypothetical protein